MNCHECKYRRNVAGSAHSSCAHPIVEIEEMKRILMLQMLIGKGYTNPTHLLADGEPVQEWEPHGIINRWVSYPFDFDPRWLNHCMLYESKTSIPDNV